jgi:hypothetical protein
MLLARVLQQGERKQKKWSRKDGIGKEICTDGGTESSTGEVHCRCYFPDMIAELERLYTTHIIGRVEGRIRMCVLEDV